MTKKLRLLTTMAAMLVLPLAACDEGSDTTTPTVTGTISGTVTVDGAGASGVTVTLNSGKSTTTSATGTYSFTDVAAGSYVVTITGFAADAAFPSAAQAAVIATAGQVITVNFTGSRIRTSAIFGSVTSGAAGLSGVTVTITGPETKTATTDANGQYSAAALRAGTYTVAISGTPNTVTCATTSQSVTVAAGESKVASFGCTANSTGKISGSLFVDENNKNDVYDGAALEDLLPAANVLITLEGPTVGTIKTAQTTATGTYEFTGLAAGTYTVKIDNTDPDVPAGFVFGGTSNQSAGIVLAAGGTATYNFPFDITTQTVKAYAFLGDDARTLPVGAAVKGVIIELYPTQTDANANTNRLSRDTTDSKGEVQFTFARSADRSPGSATVPDQIVFAKLPTLAPPDVPAGLTVNGEQVIEIRYNPKAATDLAKDTFDMLNGSATFKTDAFSIGGDTLVAWNVELFTDTTLAAVETVATSATGRASFTTLTPGALPQNVFVRMVGAQANANGHGFTRTNTSERGTPAGSFLRYTINGLTLTADTIDLGDHRVKYTDSDVFVRVYHETNDTAKWQTAGDDAGFADVANMNVGMRYTNSVGTVVNVAAQAAAAGGNTFLNIPTNGTNYTLWAVQGAVGAGAKFALEEDTLFNVSTIAPNLVSGGKQVVNVCPNSTSTTTPNCGTFGYKFENGTISGTVLSAGGVQANGMRVRVRSHSQTIQPRPTDTTVTVAAGAYSVAGLREGRYIVSILRDSVTAAGDSVWASLSNVSSNSNVDVQGPAAAVAQNFTVVRMDTKIEGVVVNDRDGDGNTVDPNEALGGSTIKVYRDGSGAITLSPDSLVCTTTTNAATGAFSCSKLREGTYAIQVTQQAGSIALRKFSGLGAVVDTAIVHTTAVATVATDNLDNVSRVGNQAPVPLPAWAFTTSTAANTSPSHFTFLYSTGTVTGTVTNAGAAVAAMAVTLNRCNTAATAPSPPAAGNCTTYFPGFTPVTMNTDATGKFTFSGLQEGVYEVTSNPATAGLPSTTPTRLLYTLSGNNDVETGTFTVP